MLFAEGHEREEAQQDFQNDKPLFLEKVKNTLYGIWISLFGIFCMTEDKSNDLMWAHYTNNRGFLLEFDYEQFGTNFFGPYPMNYIEQLERIDFSNIDKNLGFLWFLCSKNFLGNMRMSSDFFVCQTTKIILRCQVGFPILNSNLTSKTD
jgi:hypothetical protein